jgi:hypothetical protein
VHDVHPAPEWGDVVRHDSERDGVVKRNPKRRHGRLPGGGAIGCGEQYMAVEVVVVEVVTGGGGTQLVAVM